MLLTVTWLLTWPFQKFLNANNSSDFLHSKYFSIALSNCWHNPILLNNVANLQCILPERLGYYIYCRPTHVENFLKSISYLFLGQVLTTAPPSTYEPYPSESDFPRNSTFDVDTSDWVNSTESQFTWTRETGIDGSGNLIGKGPGYDVNTQDGEWQSQLQANRVVFLCVQDFFLASIHLAGCKMFYTHAYIVLWSRWGLTP